MVVESPSHAHVTARRTATRAARDASPQGEVALDRDLVLTVRSEDTSARSPRVVTHRQGEGAGTFALTVVPDLLGMAGAASRQEVVFVVDISGSMDGESLPQAQAALRLCLRHLREGDRFNVIAFENSYRDLRPGAGRLHADHAGAADAWVAALRADGRHRAAPAAAVAACRAAGGRGGAAHGRSGGQRGADPRERCSRRPEERRRRFYSFGIGTNVSDVLLKDWRDRAGGAVRVHPPGRAHRRQGGGAVLPARSPRASRSCR